MKPYTRLFVGGIAILMFCMFLLVFSSVAYGQDGFSNFLPHVLNSYPGSIETTPTPTPTPKPTRGVTPSPTPTMPPPSGDGWIYFVDETTGHVMRVRPNGTGQQNLTQGHSWSGSNHFPSPSWDGTRVVFVRYPTQGGWQAGENGDLVIMNADGSNPQVLTNTPNVDERTPSFAPGDQIVYFARNVTPSNSTTYEIYWYNLSNNKQGQITVLNQGITEDPAPSPDGNLVAFQSWDATHLYVMTAGGGNVINLTELTNPGCPGDCPIEEDPSFSPDSQWIAFASQSSGSGEIWRIRPDGSGLQQLTNLFGAFEPWWSPGGNRLSFEQYQEIYVINANGTGEEAIVTGGQFTFPRWGRDP